MVANYDKIRMQFSAVATIVLVYCVHGDIIKLYKSCDVKKLNCIVDSVIIFILHNYSTAL